MGEIMVKYSIILGTLVRKPEHVEMVKDCISLVRKYSKDYELIIVDDSSPLDTAFLKEEADVYIRHEGGNKGCAVSWNDGLRVAKGQYLVVLSDDVSVSANWLECMSACFDKFPNALASMTAVEHMPVGKEPEEKRVWIPACCFMILPKTLDIVGYFDEQFHPFNYEDVDYWTRLCQSGHTIARDYSVLVGHKEGQVIHSIEDNNSVDKKNRERYMQKWGFDPIPILYGDAKFPWE